MICKKITANGVVDWLIRAVYRVCKSKTECFFHSIFRSAAKRLEKWGIKITAIFFWEVGYSVRSAKTNFGEVAIFFLEKWGIIFRCAKNKEKEWRSGVSIPIQFIDFVVGPCIFFCKAAVASLAFFRLCLTISLLVLGDAVRLLWFDPLRVEADILCSVLHFHQSWTWPCPFYLKRTEHVFSFTS